MSTVQLDGATEQQIDRLMLDIRESIQRALANGHSVKLHVLRGVTSVGYMGPIRSQHYNGSDSVLLDFNGGVDLETIADSRRGF